MLRSASWRTSTSGGGDEVLVNDDTDGASMAGGPKPAPAKLGPAAPPGGGPLIAPPFLPEGHPAPPKAPGGFDEVRTDPNREDPVDPRRPPRRPPSDPDTELTFIEIELRDENDEPVPNARYVVVAPGNDTREGTTNREGRAREDGLIPGPCTVSSPEIHGPEWSKA